MCDLDGAKKSLESLLDEVRELKSERDRYKGSMEKILINTDDTWIAKIARQALAGKEGG